MGPDSNSGPVVEYIDGQTVEIGRPMSEITPDYSAGGVIVEEADEDPQEIRKADHGLVLGGKG